MGEGRDALARVDHDCPGLLLVDVLQSHEDVRPPRFGGDDLHCLGEVELPALVSTRLVEDVSHLAKLVLHVRYRAGEGRLHPQKHPVIPLRDFNAFEPCGSGQTFISRLHHREPVVVRLHVKVSIRRLLLHQLLLSSSACEPKSLVSGIQECGIIGPLHEFGVEEACLAVGLRVREERDLREPPASRDLKIDLVGRRQEKVLSLVCLHVHRRVDRRA